MRPRLSGNAFVPVAQVSSEDSTFNNKKKKKSYSSNYKLARYFTILQILLQTLRYLLTRDFESVEIGLKFPSGCASISRTRFVSRFRIQIEKQMIMDNNENNQQNTLQQNFKLTNFSFQLKINFRFLIFNRVILN